MTMMKKIICCALFASAASACPVMAADVYVIVNNAMELSADDVKDVFVGEKQIAGSLKIVPVDNASVQKAFLEKVLKIDAQKYMVIWTKKGFRDGLNPPVMKVGDAEVIAAVKATPGTVGYVSSVPSGVKVVQKY